MFKLTIETDNPAVLVAIANAVKNTPPVGFNEGKPVEVNIHASLADMKAAKDNVDLAPNTKVKEVVDEEPAAAAPTPPEKSENEARDERRAKLRKLVTEAGEKVEGGIPAAMAKAIAVSSVSEAKDLPDCDNFDEVCAALVALAA